MSRRVALVTGAGAGIGRAASLRLAADGWVVWAADVDSASAEAAASDIRERGGTARGVGCDVTDIAALEHVVEAVAAEHGRLDAVVANAAIFPRCSLAETDLSIARRVFDVNVAGAIATVLASRSLLAAGGGSLVLITSGSGGRSIARSAQQRGFALYGASKAALERWVLGVCDELAADGIVVQMLCPGGVVDTTGTRAVLDAVERDAGIDVDVVASAIARLCLERDPARAGDRHLAPDLV